MVSVFNKSTSLRYSGSQGETKKSGQSAAPPSTSVSGNNAANGTSVGGQIVVTAKDKPLGFSTKGNFGVSFVDEGPQTINVASKEEALALAQTAPIGTTITWGQQDTPVPDPVTASEQLADASPMSSIPAGPGGGNIQGFAKGDNCERPGGQGTDPNYAGDDGPYAPSGASDPAKEQEVYDYLTKEKGLSHEQAVGMMANMQAESSFNPGAVGDNGNSIGLFQYNAPAGRAGPMAAAVPDWRTNWKGQIDYALTQDPLGKKYAATTFNTPSQASSYFVRNFERPADLSGEIAKRGGYASRIDSTVKKD